MAAPASCRPARGRGNGRPPSGRNRAHMDAVDFRIGHVLPFLTRHSLSPATAGLQTPVAGKAATKEPGLRDGWAAAGRRPQCGPGRNGQPSPSSAGRCWRRTSRRTVALVMQVKTPPRIPRRNRRSPRQRRLRRLLPSAPSPEVGDVASTRARRRPRQDARRARSNGRRENPGR